MLKILLLSSLSSIGANPYFVSASYKTESETKYEVKKNYSSNNNDKINYLLNVTKANDFNKREVIDLTKIKTSNVKIELGNLSNSNEEEIKEYILLEIGEQNINNPGVLDVMLDVIMNPGGWKILGIDFSIPPLGETIVYKAHFRPVNIPLYKGFLSIEVALSNKTEIIKNDLSKIIENKHLGTLDDPDYNSILLKVSGITLVNTNYLGTQIVPKANSSYTGTAIITFSSTIDNALKTMIDLPNISLQTYNSEQYDSKKGIFTYDPKFGVKNFTIYFSQIKIKYSGESMISSRMGGKEFEKYENKIISNDLSVSHISIWNRKYRGAQNWNWSRSYYDISVEKNTINFEFEIKVGAYASAWNAYYSYSSAEMKIQEISFK